LCGLQILLFGQNGKNNVKKKQCPKITILLFDKKYCFQKNSRNDQIIEVVFRNFSLRYSQTIPVKKGMKKM
jgi:hypothetical protein